MQIGNEIGFKHDLILVSYLDPVNDNRVQSKVGGGGPGVYIQLTVSCDPTVGGGRGGYQTLDIT